MAHGSIEFTHWLNTSNSRLWLLGVPGAGKTVLASAVIEYALKRCDEKNAIAYFYCDYKDLESQDPVHILGGIASQIARQNQHAFDTLPEYYKTCHPEGSLHRPAQSNHLLDAILGMVSNFDNVSVLVDGLDGCGESTLDVIQWLASIGREKENVKTLFLSRAEQHIKDVLAEYPQISIAARSSDLRLYVASELQLRIRDKSLRISNKTSKNTSCIA
jgi:hypothetical protein